MPALCEVLVVKILQINHVCCVVYRPPGTPYIKFREVLDKINLALNELQSPTPDITLVGDFNFNSRDVIWEEDDKGDLMASVRPWIEREDQGDFQERRQASELFLLTNDHNMIQMVGEATREDEILDLIFSNNPDLIHAIDSKPCPSISDHNIVTATVSYYFRQDQSSTKISQDEELTVAERFQKLNFYEADWEGIHSELREQLRLTNDWAILAELEPDIGLLWFYNQLLSICEAHTPCRKSTSKKNQRKIPFHRRKAWKRLQKLYKKLKKSNTKVKVTAVLLEIKHIEAHLLEETLAKDKVAEKTATEQIRKNSKAFYAYARSRQRAKAKVGPFKDSDGNINPDPMNTVEALKKQYSSVFSTPKEHMRVEDPGEFFKDSPATYSHLTDIQFTKEDLEEACSELSSDSAAGPDGIPAKLLKECRTLLSQPLCLLWRKSMDAGYIPHDLLILLVCPVHKGGLRSIPKNFRPVALTSHIIKVFERVVRKALVNHLQDNDLMVDGQHGFRSMRSTLTQLLGHYEAVLEALESGATGYDAIYLDFSKAFDKVDHGVLLHKLRNLGVHGKVGVWLTKFLSNRFQMVACDGVISSKAAVLSGVPQGTVLGPVLFLVLILDIAANVSFGTRVSSFADDTRVSRGMKSSADPVQLQKDLETIYKWASDVNMEFNGDKFECIRYWPDHDIGSVFKEEFKYRNEDGKIIEEKEELKDLGIQLSNNLTFSAHIDKKTASCRKLMGWVMRTFRTRSRVLMLTIWNSLIQSRLDYCSQLWSPSLASEITKIEDVQRQFTKRIDGMSDLNYRERLDKLRMYSQERRRDRYMAIVIWKIAMGLIDGYSLEFTGEGSRRGRECTVAEVVRSAPTCVRRARENSLSVKGARIFNMLPAEIRNIDSDKVINFKSKLDKFLKEIPDQPTIAEEGRAAETNCLLHQIPLARANRTN